MDIQERFPRSSNARREVLRLRANTLSADAHDRTRQRGLSNRIEGTHKTTIGLMPNHSKRFRKVAKHSTLTALFARILAKQAGVSFSLTYADRWADAVTRLAGDNPRSDKTDDLRVALTRAGKISPQEMAKMIIAHHRSIRAL
jgi:16S rRNA C967 or C1407 C5-methylase (RsmB/RsmF family)